MQRRLIMIALSLLIADVVRAQVPPLGPEFRVNTYTTNAQMRASVAMDSSGSFIAVWESLSQDGSGRGIFGQRYDDEGSPLGSEFRVNTITSGQQEHPSVAMDATGRFVVVWQRPGDGSGSGIFGQRFESAGEPLGGEFQINTTTEGDQEYGDVAIDDEGDFIVVWQSRELTYPRILAQRFDVSGEPVASEFQIDEPGGYEGSLDPHVAMNGSGKFVVAWWAYGYYGGSVKMRPFSSSGIPSCGEEVVGENSYDPDVGISSSGSVVVVWSELSGSFEVMGGRYSPCTALGNAFRVNGSTVGDQQYPSIAKNGSGNFIVAWESRQDASGTGIVARQFDAAGQPVGSEFLVNTFTTGNQANAAAAMNDDGGMVLAWDSPLDGSGAGVFARAPAAVAATALGVDLHPAGPTESNLNGLLEPGETIRVEPTWQNGLSSELDLAGTASSLTGPPGPAYEIGDSSADYGLVPAGDSRGCAEATGDCFEVTITGPRPADHWDAELTEVLSTGEAHDWKLHVGESFPDVPVTHVFYADIENLFHSGVAGGCGEASYCPGDPIQRDQMAVFLLKARHGGSYAPPPCAGIFEDVPCPSLSPTGSSRSSRRA